MSSASSPDPKVKFEPKKGESGNGPLSTLMLAETIEKVG